MYVGCSSLAYQIDACVVVSPKTVFDRGLCVIAVCVMLVRDSTLQQHAVMDHVSKTYKDSHIQS